MKSKKLDLQMITDKLRERCPFIKFAIITGLDENGRTNWPENLELAVFIGSDTGTWDALEQILPVMAETVPGGYCDVTLLNRVDAKTRFRAVHGLCLFVREDMQQKYGQFVQNARLDYRIMRARGRKTGIIDND